MFCITHSCHSKCRASIIRQNALKYQPRRRGRPGRGGGAASLSANGQQTQTSSYRVPSQKKRRRPPAAGPCPDPIRERQQTLTGNFRVLSYKKRRRPPAAGPCPDPIRERQQTLTNSFRVLSREQRRKASGGQGMMPCTYLPRMTINFNGQFPRAGGGRAVPGPHPRTTTNFNEQFPRNKLGNRYSGDDVRREEVFRAKSRAGKFTFPAADFVRKTTGLFRPVNRTPQRPIFRRPLPIFLLRRLNFSTRTCQGWLSVAQSGIGFQGHCPWSVVMEVKPPAPSSSITADYCELRTVVLEVKPPALVPVYPSRLLRIVDGGLGGETSSPVPVYPSRLLRIEDGGLGGETASLVPVYPVPAVPVYPVPAVPVTSRSILPPRSARRHCPRRRP